MRRRLRTPCAPTRTHSPHGSGCTACPHGRCLLSPEVMASSWHSRSPPAWRWLAASAEARLLPCGKAPRPFPKQCPRHQCPILRHRKQRRRPRSRALARTPKEATRAPGAAQTQALAEVALAPAVVVQALTTPAPAGVTRAPGVVQATAAAARAPEAVPALAEAGHRRHHDSSQHPRPFLRHPLLRRRPGRRNDRRRASRTTARPGRPSATCWRVSGEDSPISFGWSAVEPATSGASFPVAPR